MIDLIQNLLEERTAVLARLPIQEVQLMESKDLPATFRTGYYLFYMGICF